MTSSIRRPIALALSVFLMLTLLVLATPSRAGHPGDNGPIVYGDGEQVYTVNADGSGRVTTPVTNMVGFDVSPDGTKVVGAVIEGTNIDGAVVIQDLSTGATTLLAEAGFRSAAFSGDGTRVAAAGEAGLQVRDLSSDEWEPIDPQITDIWDWSPVDNRALVTRTIPAPFPALPAVSLETIDVDTGAETVIDDNESGLFTWYVTGGDFSPDGEDIVYTAFTPGHAEVVIAGQEDDPLAETNAMGGPTGPVTWSPDGTRIAFALSTVEGESIVVHTVGTGAQAPFAAAATVMDWAPVPTTTPPPGEVDFDDVPDGHVFAADIAWLAEQGITRGCNPPTNSNFCPDDNVTRGQMAAFLVRAFGYTDDGGGDLFDDDNGNVFEGDIDRLATAGVTRGCNPPTNNNFCPDDNVTRGQMAAFLHRAIGD